MSKRKKQNYSSALKGGSVITRNDRFLQPVTQKNLMEKFDRKKNFYQFDLVYNFLSKLLDQIKQRKNENLQLISFEIRVIQF